LRNSYLRTGATMPNSRLPLPELHYAHAVQTPLQLATRARVCSGAPSGQAQTPRSSAYKTRGLKRRTPSNHPYCPAMCVSLGHCSRGDRIPFLQSRPLLCRIPIIKPDRGDCPMLFRHHAATFWLGSASRPRTQTRRTQESNPGDGQCYHVPGVGGDNGPLAAVGCW
jgi:hypothetical protein